MVYCGGVQEETQLCRLNNFCIRFEVKSAHYGLRMALLLLTAVAAWTCRVEAQPAPETRSVLVGVVVDNYPFSFRDKDGRVKGFACDLVNEIEQVTNLRFRRIEGTTDEIYKLFQEGKIDLLQNYVVSPEREAIAEFSVPYITMSGQVFVRKGISGVKTLSDLRGRKLPVHRGSLGEKIFKDAGLGAGIVYVDSVEQALVLVNRGEGDATFAARLTGLAIIHRLGLRNIRPSLVELKDHEMRCCVAVRKGEHALLARINEGLAILMRTGRFEELYQRWFGSVTPRRYTKEQFMAAVAIGLAIALAVTIWAIIRQQKLSARIRRQAEAVRESERKYRTLFETANDAIFLMREDKFVDCNVRASAMFGAPRDKLIGARPFDFSPPTQPDGRPSKEKAVEKISAAYTHGPQFFEWEHCRADGSRFMTEVSLNRFEIGTEAFLLAVVRDITKRKAAELRVRQSEERYRRLYESMVDAFVAVTMDGRIQEFNSVYREMLGYSEDELKQLTYTDLTPHQWHAFEAKIVEEQVLKRGYSDVYEKEYRRKDGTVFPVELRTFLIRDDTGQPTGMWAIVRDITERKRAEAALREKEYMLSESQRIAQIGSWKAELNGTIIWSAETYRIYGVAPESFTLTKDTFVELVHPDDRQAMRDWIDKCHAGEKPCALDFRIIRPDGTVRFLRGQGELIYGPDGKPSHLAGTVQDITERKHAEAALAESEARFRALAETTAAAIVVYQGNRFRFVNPAAQRLTGYTEAEALAASFWDIVHPDHRELVRQRGLARQRGEPVPSRYEFKIITKNGEERWIDFSAGTIMFGGEPAGLATAFDITDRKRAEAALRESEERFRLLAESSLVGIYLFQDDKFIYVNPALAAIFGYSVDEIVGKMSPLDLTHPDDRGLVVENIHRRIAEGLPSLRYEFRGLRKDGTALYLESHGGRLKYRDRPAIMGTLVDITERKRIEAALRKSEQRYREMLEQAPSAIFVHDTTGRLIEVNKKACESLGYSRAELLGKHIGEIDPEAIRAGKDKLWENVLKGQQVTLQSRHVRKDGTSFPVEITLGSIHLDQGPAIFGVAQDITERLRAEEALHALTARLQEVREEEGARIARELHDELGQLLTGLKMDLHWVERDLEDQKPTKRVNVLLDKIVGASELVDTAIKTVQRICAELRPALLDKLGLVEALKCEARQFQKRTRIKCKLHMPDTEPVLPPEVATACYRICQEALTNVARHANATTVEIELQVENPKPQRTSKQRDHQTPRLVLEIRDNGCGIAPAKVAHSQSLGLIGMQERARALGGTLTIRPGPKGGTIVTLSVPQTQNRKTKAYESADS